MDIARIADVAAGEAERQGTDFNGYVRLLNAYRWAATADNAIPLHPNYVYMLANLVEPDTNSIFLTARYRQTPVTFTNGGHAVDWDLVPTAMSQWFDMVNERAHDGDLADVMSDDLVYEFLRIHPFRDGNGRVAWILRTRFYDQWASPDPLPKYFPGE